MVNHEQIARSLFLSGCNCAQAVFGAFADEMGMRNEFALRLSSSFGGGMGRMREVCGAVSGMFMVIGVMCGYSDPEDKKAKAEHYALIQKLAGEFRERNGGSIICRELLGGISHDTSPNPTERDDAFYKKRPCVEIVADAARICEAELVRRNLITL